MPGSNDQTQSVSCRGIEGGQRCTVAIRRLTRAQAAKIDRDLGLSGCVAQLIDSGSLTLPEGARLTGSCRIAEAG